MRCSAKHFFLSSVHNWTVEDAVQWLKESVELPQYEKHFRDFGVTGNTLPRLVQRRSTTSAKWP